MDDRTISRRRVLAGVGAGLAGAALSSTASAGERDRYIVGTDSVWATAAARARADEVIRTLELGDRGTAVVGRFPQAAREALAGRAGVRYVEPDQVAHAVGQTVPWGVDRVDADVVHGNGETGGDGTDGEGGADIAVVDTGIDSNHSDLEANLGTGYAAVTCDSSYGDCNYDWDDDNGHGTHCAGTADAVDDTSGVVGVATGATLHAVKVLDEYGSGYYSDIAEGLRWVADQGYDVASLSLGGSSSSSTMRDACQYAVDNGVTVVAAAGNDGECTDCVLYPAAYSTVIAVSATNSNDELAYFSSQGPEIELAAPGSEIYSTEVGDTYGYKSGTSMACPHVSGAAGQLMDNGYTNSETRQRLKDTAEDIGLSSNEQGAGLLDVEAALGGSTDAGPSVSWVTPTDGDTVSGTVTVQIDASDAEDGDDSLDVTWQLGTTTRSTTYNSTSGYYEDTWDTTQVADDKYGLTAAVTDSAGNTTSTTIGVVVDNTDSAPAVDSLSASEVETSDSDAEFDIAWDVSDADGDLSSLDLVLTEDSTSSTTTQFGGSLDAGDLAQHTYETPQDYDELVVTLSGSGDVDLYVSLDGGAARPGTADRRSVSLSGEEQVVVERQVSELGIGVATTTAAEYDLSVSASGGDGDGDVGTATTEDSTTVSVSGSSDSGTTRLVAAGDDGTGNAYTVEATVTDSAGGTDSATASVTESEAAPTVTELSLSEVETADGDAALDATWAVSDADADLATVDLTLTDDTAGETEDTASVGVSGEAARDTTRLVAAGDEGTGNAYTVELVVTDSFGNSATATASATESEAAPAVDSLSASEVETSDGDAEFDVSWDVSDGDGDLSGIDLALIDSGGTTEDTASASVSGSSASGTTRLVAAGDEGTGNSYTVDVVVSDTDGTTATATTSVTESEAAPAVDSLSASEIETSNSDAEFDVSWSVSDSDGDLSSVDLSLTDDTDGESEDSATLSVSGSSDSGTTRLVAAGDDGSGNSYTVEATVTDSFGNAGSDTATVDESGDTNTAPTASVDRLRDRSNPAWTRYDVSWSASDADGNLDTVVVALLDGSGTALDSVTKTVSGTSASGTDEVRSKQKRDASAIVVTATDTAGADGSDSRSI